MTHESLGDTVNQVTQAFPITAAAATFMGMTLNEWVQVSALAVAALNIIWYGVRFYDRFKHSKGKDKAVLHNPGTRS